MSRPGQFAEGLNNFNEMNAKAAASASAAAAAGAGAGAGAPSSHALGPAPLPFGITQEELEESFGTPITPPKRGLVLPEVPTPKQQDYLKEMDEFTQYIFRITPAENGYIQASPENRQLIITTVNEILKLKHGLDPSGNINDELFNTIFIPRCLKQFDISLPKLLIPPLLQNRPKSQEMVLLFIFNVLRQIYNRKNPMSPYIGGQRKLDKKRGGSLNPERRANRIKLMKLGKLPKKYFSLKRLLKSLPRFSLSLGSPISPSGHRLPLSGSEMHTRNKRPNQKVKRHQTNRRSRRSS
jgi:hypothetical protein